MKKVLVIGTPGRLDEFKNLPLQNAEVTYLDQVYLDLDEASLFIGEMETPDDEYFMEDLDLSTFDVVFDLNMDDFTPHLDYYMDHEDLVVFGCAVKTSVGEMIHFMEGEVECTLVGMNALPSFINRDRLELSLAEPGDEEVVATVMKDLGLAYELVDDRVGMVTPRIVCMIINEACYVLKEGTAGIRDVDQAMKLGTNYPHGPFEWADRIGIHNVMEVLEAMQGEMQEEKYKIAPLLRQYYHRNQPFYS